MIPVAEDDGIFCVVCMYLAVGMYDNGCSQSVRVLPLGNISSVD
jgi:hypothetical protein